MPDHHLLLRGLRLPDDEAVPGRHPRIRQHPAVHPEDQEHVPEVHVQIRDGQCRAVPWLWDLKGDGDVTPPGLTVISHYERFENLPLSCVLSDTISDHNWACPPDLDA